jgi:hypothetical protein
MSKNEMYRKKASKRSAAQANLPGLLTNAKRLTVDKHLIGEGAKIKKRGHYKKTMAANADNQENQSESMESDEDLTVCI